MAHAYFFGYGSLVNGATHDYDQMQAATLPGWRRVWRHTEQRDIAFLSIEPAKGSVIDGMVARVPNGDWGALDQREWAYRRTPAAGAVHHDLPTSSEVAFYVVPTNDKGGTDKRHPILLSYLDAVVQGYLREFSETGATAFFRSTVGWDAPILDDRAAPLYPRHQVLTPCEQAFVDAALAQIR
jgi:hypothetical protein